MGRAKICLSLEQISPFFQFPISEAAKALKLSKTTLKQRCRELGIDQWPFKRDYSQKKKKTVPHSLVAAISSTISSVRKESIKKHISTPVLPGKQRYSSRSEQMDPFSWRDDFSSPSPPSITPSSPCHSITFQQSSPESSYSPPPNLPYPMAVPLPIPSGYDSQRYSSRSEQMDPFSWRDDFSSPSPPSITPSSPCHSITFQQSSPESSYSPPPNLPYPMAVPLPIPSGYDSVCVHVTYSSSSGAFPARTTTIPSSFWPSVFSHSSLSCKHHASVSSHTNIVSELLTDAVNALHSLKSDTISVPNE
ncbi:Transcription factor RKD-like protein [Aduncisulcus paluster]|uniref:Transcription factor RKD-like protein n=1 Tax=Aduncisulcus paluster TaxID=2918883 RepID=A0ABQ5K7S4_9EUKA|nr:Transcription factor RKD-like protein [Aduncisulcus paluster]